MKQLVWNVIYHNMNGQRIETFNVFKHSHFVADVEKALKRCATKDIKIDVYWQIMNNWDIFLDYVWSAKPAPRIRKKIAAEERVES